MTIASTPSTVTAPPTPTTTHGHGVCSRITTGSSGLLGAATGCSAGRSVAPKRMLNSLPRAPSLMITFSMIGGDPA